MSVVWLGLASKVYAFDCPVVFASLALIASLLFVVQVPRVKSKISRDILSYLMVVAAGYLAFLLFGAFTQKTGMRINTYLGRK